jgi:DNA polymerase-3 subunit epsilon
VSAQPHVVQLAAILFDGDRPVSHLSCVIVPEMRGERVQIAQEVIDIHGISNELVDSVGLPPKTGWAMFNNLLRRADRLVAHNIDFDVLVSRAAYSRMAVDPQVLIEIPKVCTMRSSEDVLKLPGKYGYKWPSLQEAHEYFLGEKFEGAHDAMVDVLACSRVLFALEEKGHKLKC